MTTSIYPTLNGKIQTILEGIAKIKSIYAYPTAKIDSYPAAIYYPSSIDNSFETTSENRKRYGYKLWIVINTEATTVQNGFTVMPRVMDAILEKLDDDWSFTSIDGHRVWCQVNTGDWSVAQTQNGIEIAAEINLSINLLTN